MGFLDEAKDKANELSDKAKQAVDALDEKSGGKIGEARQKAEGLADKAKDKLPTDKIPGMQAKGEDDKGGPA